LVPNTTHVLGTNVDDISDEHFSESYMGGLKQDIKHDIFLRHSTNIMEAMQFARHIQAKNKDTHKSIVGEYTISRDRFGVHKIRIATRSR
jgi:hypothetical protein